MDDRLQVLIDEVMESSFQIGWYAGTPRNFTMSEYVEVSQRSANAENALLDYLESKGL